MFIRFEVAGQGLWRADWDVATPHAWRVPLIHRRSHRLRGVKLMRPEVREKYTDLHAHLMSGVIVPPASAYTAPPGRRCITFFRVVEPTRDRIRDAWTLITLLRKHGWPAYEIVVHTPPGPVTYRDEHQIVVSIPTRPRRDPAWDGDRETIRRPHQLPH